ncbi:MAG: hypothetical protein IVW57_15250 [Ktedonobacterales bacterium]|nr:hypothetical protein [Ktedonobacterales bacterium]
MTTFAVYTDVEEFLTFSAFSVETSSLVGGRATLSADVSAGATTLPLSAITNFATGQTAWLLDGLTSEKVTITAVGGSSMTTSATAVGHSAGASVSTAGTHGCLAEQVTLACRKADQYCRQGALGSLDRTLFALSRRETFTMPTSRAYIDPNWTLTVTPYHFPVQSLTSLSLQNSASPAMTVDLSALVLPEGAKKISVPQISLSGSGNTTLLLAAPVALRQPNTWATLTYVGGPIIGATLASVPDDIRMAVWCYIAHLLAFRFNPAGVAMQSMGDTRREFRLRGETGAKAKSLYRDEAEDYLAPYRAG